MDEPDIMFLNGAEVVFYLLCSVSLIIGVQLGSKLWASAGSGPRPRPPQIPAWAMSVPLVIGIAATLVSTGLLLDMHPVLLSNLLSGRGADIKIDLMSGALPYGANTFPPVAAGIAWWALWKSRDCIGTHLQVLTIRGVAGMAILAAISFEIIVLFRGELLAVMIGTAVTFLAIRQSAGELTRKFLLQIFAGILLPMGGGMLVFSVLRGVANKEELFSEALGYTLATYNRLAAMLNGTLQFPYGGHGIYVSSKLLLNKSVNALTSLGTGYNPHDVWWSEFDAVQRAGLNGKLIWPGVYGDVYSDAGMLTPLVLVLFGVIIGFVWRKFERRETLGCVLYPAVAALLLTMFGPNLLFSGENIALLLVGICLSFYEQQFALKPRTSRPQPSSGWLEPASRSTGTSPIRTV